MSLQIFPKVTKCETLKMNNLIKINSLLIWIHFFINPGTFKMFGPSGTLQIYDAMCVLPVNIINEKIFIFLWFWFIILAILSSISILSRLANIISPKVRFFLLQRAAGKGMINPTRLNTVFRRCHVILSKLIQLI